MTYEMYRYVFLGAAIAGGIVFVIAVVLFFTLRIPKVINDLTGRTAKKAIETIRVRNAQSGDKAYQPSAVNLERGKLTDRITGSGRLIPREAPLFGTGAITEKISTPHMHAADAEAETTLLTYQDETTVLGAEAGETTVLCGDDMQPTQEVVLEYEITFIHTDEVIA